MLNLELGRTYRFTLLSGRSVDIIVHGSQPNPSDGTNFTISVNGVQGIYSSINQALGESVTQVALV